MNEKIAVVTSTTSYIAGAGSAVFGAISINDMAIISGVVLSLGTFVLNWFYKHKTYKLQAKKAEGDENVKI